MAACLLQIVFSLIKGPGDLAQEFLPIFTRAHNFSSNCSLQMCYFPTASFPSEGGCLKICIYNVKQHLVLTQKISSSANLVAAAEEIRFVECFFFFCENTQVKKKKKKSIQCVKRVWTCWQTATDSNKHQNPGGLHHVALTLSPLNIMFPIPRRQQLMQVRLRVPLSHSRPHMCLLKRLLPLWHVLEIWRSSWRGRVINRRRSRACYEMIRLPPLGGPVICWFCPC